MAAERIEKRLREAAGGNSGVLLPYFTSGYPDVETTGKFIQAADALGVPVIELGVPYSDSIADGPVIQASFHSVLARGQTLEDTFSIVSGVRASLRCAIVAMVSYSILHRTGVEAFCERAASAGFDGLIVPDVPVEEAPPVSAATCRAGLGYVGLVAPTTTPARREAIARASTGFIYQIAVAGTTGERLTIPTGLHEEVSRLRDVSGLPVCVGFGVSTAEHVRAICELADGAIVGSAIIRRIREALEARVDSTALIAGISAFLSELISGVSDGRLGHTSS